MPKKDQCFRTIRYVRYGISGTIYCAVKAKHKSSTVTWCYWSRTSKMWRFSTYASSSQSAYWLSKSHYQKLDVLPNDVLPYIQKEY